MRKTRRWTGLLIVLGAASYAVACDSPAEVEDVDPDAVVVISSLSPLVPGQVVTATGSHLNAIARFTADGQLVHFTAQSAEHGTFQMPATRACDVDGRQVEVVANGQYRASGSLRLQGAMSLEIGESRILSAEDLSCMQINGAMEDYLLSVASFTPDHVTEDVMSLRSVGAQGGAAGVSGMVAPEMAARLMGALDNYDHHQTEVHPQVLANTGSDVSAQAPFDDYANAQVGDVLEFVNWASPSVFTAETREDVPTYEGVVVAVTDGQLIVADLRQDNVERFSDPEVREKYHRAGEIVDAVGVRALRAVIDPALEIPAGAGGRVVTMIRPLGSDLGGGARASEISGNRWASNMYMTLLNSSTANGTPGGIAAIIIHEEAHLADIHNEIEGRGPRSLGWYSEALAVSVEDMAARMAVGSEYEADFSRAYDDGIPVSRIARSPSYSSMSHSPWGTSPGALGTGAYDRGARIVRYVQSLLGQTGFQPSGQTLHQRLMARAADGSQATLEEALRPWGIEALAEQAGMNVHTLLEASMMADLTDDLVPDAAIERFGIPQIASWDHTPDEPGTYRDARDAVVDRDQGLDADVSVPAGGYVYWYIPAEDGKGLSLQADNVNLQEHHQVRIIRLR